MLALIIKEFRELARDRRTLVLLVALPVVLLIVFGYAANLNVAQLKVAVVSSDAADTARQLQALPGAAERLHIVSQHPAGTDPVPLLQRQEADVVFVADSADPRIPLIVRSHVHVDGASLLAAEAAQGIFARLLAADLAPHLAADPDLARLAELGTAGALPLTVHFNPDLRTSWVMIPGLIGLVLSFVGTIITSIGLVREREAGTLEQLAVMPLRPSAIILGKITPYLLLALADMVVITVVGRVLFDVPFVGSLALFAFTAVVFCFLVLGIGVFVSSVSGTTGQAVQSAIMFVMPQVLLSGLVFPLEAMPLGIRALGYCFPLTWFIEVAHGLMLRGAPVGHLAWPVGVLTAMAVVSFGAATVRMRWLLTHGGAR
ncbi:ABC transporter permease [Buchananella hordeovulneris]|uniref:ABC transporter permease n=1 Tax=Buchananella hordeovulneris TaxID=52770 RepID=UPI0026DCD19D|nr:ABC transporter permease [Buchananella hordeovulneris]MDO5081631.1 ABC transporter permease [Buchananella hordeovulneris]